MTVSGGPFVYNGTAQPAVATAVGLDGMTAVAGSFAITYNGSSSVPVNASTYTVVANFTSSNPNYSTAVRLMAPSSSPRPRPR